LGGYADTPHNSGSTYAKVHLPIPETLGALFVRGDTFTQSATTFTNVVSPPGSSTLPRYTLANFRVEWQGIAQTGATASVWVKNAFNTEYYTGGLSAISLGYNTANPGEPRMYGADLEYRF
jgi:iron complex outermembrane receptor protein